ncbi:UNVERIFIED_CONTAM: hypothetical protein Sindi_3072400, partial [Sesamum indicum]
AGSRHLKGVFRVPERHGNRTGSVGPGRPTLGTNAAERFRVTCKVAPRAARYLGQHLSCEWVIEASTPRPRDPTHGTRYRVLAVHGGPLAKMSGRGATPHCAVLLGRGIKDGHDEGVRQGCPECALDMRRALRAHAERRNAEAERGCSLPSRDASAGSEIVGETHGGRLASRGRPLRDAKACVPRASANMGILDRRAQRHAVPRRDAFRCRASELQCRRHATNSRPPVTHGEVVTINNNTGLYESGNWNEYNLNPLTRIHWRASLVPAAAVIPAPIAWTLGWAGRSASGVHRSSRPFCRRCAPGLNWPGRASGAVTLKKLECSKQAYALYTLAWDNIIGFRSYYVGLRDRTFAKDVFINQERKLGARRRSDTVLVSTINDADQGSADVAFRTPPAPYEKSKSLGSGGSMVARLKLKGIDGRAPPGVEPAA